MKTKVGLLSLAIVGLLSVHAYCQDIPDIYPVKNLERINYVDSWGIVVPHYSGVEFLDDSTKIMFHINNDENVEIVSPGRCIILKVEEILHGANKGTFSIVLSHVSTGYRTEIRNISRLAIDVSSDDLLFIEKGQTLGFFETNSRYNGNFEYQVWYGNLPINPEILINHVNVPDDLTAFEFSLKILENYRDARYIDDRTFGFTYQGRSIGLQSSYEEIENIVGKYSSIETIDFSEDKPGLTTTRYSFSGFESFHYAFDGLANQIHVTGGNVFINNLVGIGSSVEDVVVQLGVPTTIRYTDRKISRLFSRYLVDNGVYENVDFLSYSVPYDGFTEEFYLTFDKGTLVEMIGLITY